MLLPRLRVPVLPQRKRYRYCPLDPNLCHPNSQIIQSSMGITLLSLLPHLIWKSLNSKEKTWFYFFELSGGTCTQLNQSLRTAALSLSATCSFAPPGGVTLQGQYQTLDQWSHSSRIIWPSKYIAPCRNWHWKKLSYYPDKYGEARAALHTRQIQANCAFVLDIALPLALRRNNGFPLPLIARGKVAFFSQQAVMKWSLGMRIWLELKLRIPKRCFSSFFSFLRSQSLFEFFKLRRSNWATFSLCWNPLMLSCDPLDSLPMPMWTPFGLGCSR